MSEDLARQPGLGPANGAGSPPTLLMVTTVPVTLRNFLVPYAAHFRNLGWRVHAAASDVSQDRLLADAFDEVHDVPFSRSLRRIRPLLESERKMRQMILAIRPDLVHVHTPIAALVTRIAIRRLTPRVRPGIVYTAHGFHFFEGGRVLTNAAFKLVERIAGRWTDRLIVINDEDERAARDLRIVPERNLVRMPGVGLDTDHYAPMASNGARAAALMEDLGMSADTPYFAVVAELHPNKRPADVIRALAEAHHPDVNVVFAGEGPLRGDLELLARRLGLGARVRFAGYLKDVRPLLWGAAATILASRREGLPRSIMESLACGTPVIASNARGVAELLAEGSGLLVSNVPRELPGAMDWVLDHPREARAMGARGRVRMRNSYDVRSLLARHERLYRELLAQRSRTHALLP